METEHLSRYARLMSSLARDALALADTAPTRVDAPGHPARLGIPAARALLAPADTDRDRPGLDALTDALADGQTRFNDALGFTRPVYRPLLIHLAFHAGCSAQAPPASAGEANGQPPHLALWHALCLHESGDAARALPLAESTLATPGDDGALHPRGPEDQLDAWTWRELTGLHALTWLAERADRDDWRQRTHAIAEHHQRVTQPDYTTYQPWGVAAFVLTPGCTLFADQQLHDARTNLHLEGGGAGLLPGLLLADAANLLQHIEART